MDSFDIVNNTPRNLPDGTPNPAFLTGVKKLFRRYWLADRLFRIIICGIVTVGLLITKTYFAIEDGVISDSGLIVVAATVIIYMIIMRVWNGYRGQEIYLGRGEIHNDLFSYDYNFEDMSSDGCLLKAILRTYYPEKFWFVLAWLAVIFYIGIIM